MTLHGKRPIICSANRIKELKYGFYGFFGFDGPKFQDKFLGAEVPPLCVEEENKRKMQQAWRNAGISYLRYTNINAVLTRRALKEPFRTEAQERNITNMRVSIYEKETGKPLIFKQRE